MTIQRNIGRIWGGGAEYVEEDPGSAKYDKGWEKEHPKYQHFNHLLHSLSRNQKVLAESNYFTYDADVTYSLGAKAIGSDGTTYTSKVAGNTNDPVTDTAKLYWGVSPEVSNKNYIVNPSFQSWQEGQNLLFSSVGGGIPKYVADVYRVASASTFTLNGYLFDGRSSQLNSTSAAAFKTDAANASTTEVVMFVESMFDFKVGDKVTLSFEAKTDYTPYTLPIDMYGTSPTNDTSSTDSSTGSVDITGTATSFAVTFDVPDWEGTWGGAHVIDNTIPEEYPLGIRFMLPAGLTNLLITNIKLEKGSVATPFEYISYEENASQCNRYLVNYNHLNSIEGYLAGTGDNKRYITMPFPSKVRVETYAVTQAWSLGTAVNWSISDRSPESVTVANDIGNSTNVTTLDTLKIDARYY